MSVPSGLSEVVVARLGAFLLAFDARQVGEIEAAGPPAGAVVDLADLMGLDREEVTAAGAARRTVSLEAAGGEVRLVAGATVRLERVPAQALEAPPSFLADLWRELCVSALVRLPDRTAFLIDPDALAVR